MIAVTSPRTVHLQVKPQESALLDLLEVNAPLPPPTSTIPLQPPISTTTPEGALLDLLDLSASTTVAVGGGGGEGLTSGVMELLNVGVETKPAQENAISAGKN